MGKTTFSRDTPEVAEELKKKFVDSQKLTRKMFLANYGEPLAQAKESQQVHLAAKIFDEYHLVKNLPPPKAPERRPESARQPKSTEIIMPGATIEDAHSDEDDAGEEDGPQKKKQAPSKAALQSASVDAELAKMIEELPKNAAEQEAKAKDGALIAYKGGVLDHLNPRTALLLRQRERLRAQPTWHAPWKLMRVISGHMGWVRCVATDPANEWFATGAADRTIKIWDLASGVLKLTLTGHISTVRGLAVSARHPYLFSVSEDKTVRCWDLEYNKVIRSYHGHLSGVYCVELHPTIDVLLSGGRDSTCRVWDIRTKAQIKALSGHTNTVASIKSQPVEPQVITGSHDSTIRCWDLVAGKASSILTNHKKSVRNIGIHHSEYTFFSGSADNIKVWKCPEGQFMRNISGHNSIINTMALNHDNVLVSAGDNGTMHFYDWKTGYNFQQMTAVVQPGSLDSENGIFAMSFDQTGSRLITCEADKTIKIYKEDDGATEESHPINYKPPKKRHRY